MGKASAIVVLHEAPHAIEIGMRDKQSCCSPYRFMRSEKAAIVVNGRARPEAANQAKRSRFLAGRVAAFGAQFALISLLDYKAQSSLKRWRMSQSISFGGRCP